MEEIWKDKKDYEGHYQVSNCGGVKSIKFGKERILKPFTDGRGYLFVNLSKNGKVKNFSIHRLVAQTFLDNPNNLPCVNHKDECKTNNNVTNLEFCTYEYNSNFGTRNERIAAKNTNGKLSKTVLQYDLEGNFIREWESTAECGRNGFNRRHITECCRGKRKTHKKYIWRYKNEQ